MSRSPGNRGDRRSVLGTLGCRVGVWGRLANFSFPYVAVRASEVRVGVHGAFDLPPREADWDERVRRFCEILDVPCSASPGWHVAAEHSW